MIGDTGPLREPRYIASNDEANRLIKAREGDAQLRELACRSCAGASRPCEQHASEMVAEVDLNHLRAGDQLIILTLHSVYLFTVTDPALRYGELRGMHWGGQPMEAFLMQRPADDNRSNDRHSKLNRGANAVFIIKDRPLRRLMTSMISGLIYRKKSQLRSGKEI